MARDLLVQVSIPADNGIPEDAVVNTYAFICGDTDVGIDITSALDDWYQDVGKYFSPTLSRAFPPHVKTYNIEDPTPRVPLTEYDLSLLPSPSGASALPAEIAFCVSWHGLYESGQANARRRGRVYLGPFHTGVNVVTAGEARPSSAFLSDVAGALTTFVADCDTEGYDLAVWSRMDSFLYNVTHVFMDNEWDIQRRRGRRATLRQEIAV